MTLVYNACGWLITTEYLQASTTKMLCRAILISLMAAASVILFTYIISDDGARIRVTELKTLMPSDHGSLNSTSEEWYDPHAKYRSLVPGVWIPLADTRSHDMSTRTRSFVEPMKKDKKEKIETRPFFGDFFYTVFQTYAPIHGYAAILVCSFGIVANVANITILSR